MSLHPPLLNSPDRPVSLDRRRWSRVILWTLSIALAIAIPRDAHRTTAAADDLGTAEALFQTGHYDEAAQVAAAEVERGVWNERWPKLLLLCQLETGRHAAAVQTYVEALQRYPTSLSLRLLGIQAHRVAGDESGVVAQTEAFTDVLRRSTSRYASRDNVLAAGQFFAAQGEDARLILKQFYDRVRDADPNFIDVYLATAELAIEKGDFQVAGQTLAAAAEIQPDHPDVQYLTAVAFQSSDAAVAGESLDKALQINPRHTDSLLLRAEQLIDRERYDEAQATLQSVLRVNPHHPLAWSLMAVLAHLRGQFELEALMRAAALSPWQTNPQVDHCIGRKLSDKYRFAEGAEYQRRSLALVTDYAPARFQLAQDLLRMGFDDVGWTLAEEVNRADPYNVVAHNLVSLYDHIKTFRMLGDSDLQLRMDPHEAAIYGDDVLQLVRDARGVLFEKYEVTQNGPIVVEIFPDQADFAIRTFGLPGGAGFLGVCFGNVITANSPASQGTTPSNWKAVLWHEFTHVATLTKTNNRMPRWLSEGISVYEERQRDPSWGERINPRYKQMIQAGDLTPVGELSGAFLSPKSPLHLQFAYYQSSLVVEFLVDRFGIESLRGVLEELAAGLTIDDALARHTLPIDQLDQPFRAFVDDLIDPFGHGLDWSTESEGSTASEDRDADGQADLSLLDDNPNSYVAIRSLADAAMRSDQFADARDLLLRLCDAGVQSGEAGGVPDALATVYRELGDVDGEIRALELRTRNASDALSAHIRLAELARSRDDWQEVTRQSRRILDINPLMIDGHQWAAAAAQATDRPASAIAALRSMLQLDPIDPAGLRYQLAAALEQTDDLPAAKRVVLEALEQAPRYRDALALLLRVEDRMATPTSPAQEANR